MPVFQKATKPAWILCDDHEVWFKHGKNGAKAFQEDGFLLDWSFHHIFTGPTMNVRNHSQLHHYFARDLQDSDVHADVRGQADVIATLRFELHPVPLCIA